MRNIVVFIDCVGVCSVKPKFSFSSVIVVVFGIIGVYCVMNHFIPRIGAFVIIPCVLYIYAFFRYGETIQEEYSIRDIERRAVLKHARKKQDVILKNHPLPDPDSPYSYHSMDELDHFFQKHEGEVANMDWVDGRYIFANHKYIQKPE